MIGEIANYDDDDDDDALLSWRQPWRIKPRHSCGKTKRMLGCCVFECEFNQITIVTSLPTVAATPEVGRASSGQVDRGTRGAHKVLPRYLGTHLPALRTWLPTIGTY